MSDVLKLTHLIDGQWIEAEDYFERIDPYRNVPVTLVPMGTSDEMDAALEAATRAKPTAADMPGYERAKILHRLAELIVRDADKIGELMARETGKAIKDAIGEVRRSQDTITLSAEEAIRIEGEQIPLEGSEMGAGKIAFTLRFPVGVIGAITPFNAPFNLACHKIGPAFASGNTIVLKSPPQAAGVVHKLAELCVEAGFPAGVLNVVHGESDIGEQLVKDPRSDFISFTGSSEAGAHIKANSGLKRVALELGGNGQTIVHSNGNVATAAKQAARNAVRLAGQSCISVQTVHVHRSRIEEFTKLALTELSFLKLGDPLDPETDIGTLIDEPTADRVKAAIAGAQREGAEVLTGGNQIGAAIEPTMLSNISTNMDIFREEIFGPVFNVIPYDEFDEAIHRVNSGKYGLQCGVFTCSLHSAMRAVKKIRTGGVIINGTSTWRTDQLAYGGVKDSGIGREGPRYAIREMTEERLVLFNM